MPDKSLEELVAAQYDELVKKRQQESGLAPNVGEPAKPSEFKLNIGGQERTFASQEDVSQYVNDMLEAQRRAAAEAIQNLPGQRVTAGQQTTEPVPIPDLDEFAKRLKENPAEAFNYVDKFRYGVDNPAQILREIWQKQQVQEQTLAAYQFRDDHPEFVRTPENAQTLMQLVQQNGLPFTYDGLELAYSVGKERGLLKTQDQQNQRSTTPEPTPTRSVAPPRIGRGTSDGGAPDVLDYVDDLDADQIAKIITQFEGRR